MLNKDVAKTDWSEVCNEDHSLDAKVMYTNSNYPYTTKSSQSVFKKGLNNTGTHFDDENMILEIVSDSVDSRCVPMFIDYNRFSNPFIKYSRKSSSSKPKKLQKSTVPQMSMVFRSD